MSTFREPTSELPEWIVFDPKHPFLRVWDRFNVGVSVEHDVADAEALLEVLLDICPNAKALAHNWLLEEQKREHLKGWKP